MPDEKNMDEAEKFRREGLVEDDVEGQKMRAKEGATEDDVEGHKMRAKEGATEDDVEGHIHSRK